MPHRSPIVALLADTPEAAHVDAMLAASSPTASAARSIRQRRSIARTVLVDDLMVLPVIDAAGDPTAPVVRRSIESGATVIVTMVADRPGLGQPLLQAIRAGATPRVILPAATGDRAPANGCEEEFAR